MILLQILESVLVFYAVVVVTNNIRKLHLSVKLNDYTTNAVDIIRNYKGYYKIYVAEMSSDTPNKTVLMEIVGKRLFVDDIANKIPEARIISDICRRHMRNIFVTFRLSDGTDSNMVDLYLSHTEEIDSRLLTALEMLGFDIDDVESCTIYEKNKNTQTISANVLRELYNNQYK